METGSTSIVVNQQISTLEKKERLVNSAEKAINLLERLNQLDQRTEIIMADAIRNQFQPEIKQISPNHDNTEWTVQDRLQYREIRGIDNYQSVIGKKAKKLFIADKGIEPTKAKRLLSGKQRNMTVYIGDDVIYIDQAIDFQLNKLGLGE